MRIIFATLAICLVSCSAFAENIEFSLATGDYLLNAKYRIAGQAQMIEQSDYFVLSYKDDGIYLLNAKQPEYPIIAQYSDNRFYAHIDDAAGVIKFEGSLVSDNHVAGQMAGNSTKKGELSGSFELKPASE